MKLTDREASERGISKEGVAALGFGLTVVMMAVVGAALMQTGENLSGGGPIVSTSADEVEPGTGPDAQWVRIYHEGGETVDVRNLSIIVRLPDHNKRSTLSDLPTAAINPSNYDHNHIFTLEREGTGIAGAIDANETDGSWRADESFAFRLEPSRVRLEDGQQVVVVLRHTGTESRLAKLELVVGE